MYGRLKEEHDSPYRSRNGRRDFKQFQYVAAQRSMADFRCFTFTTNPIVKFRPQRALPPASVLSCRSLVNHR
jgi:hypothetical protein